MLTVAVPLGFSLRELFPETKIRRNRRPPTMSKEVVLSIEDNDADFYCIEMALHDWLPSLNIRRAADGEQAIKLFEKIESTPATWLPDLVLLDRNLPRVDGFQVLTYLNDHQFTARVPVVMFTSAATPQDVRRAIQLGARDVVIKPANLDDLVQRLKQVCEKEIGK
jgi:CheY-like chemotaxis protein